MDLKKYCGVNGIKWPLCKRFVTDWSWALINTCIKTCNDDIKSMGDYLNKCYSLLVANSKKK